MNTEIRNAHMWSIYAELKQQFDEMKESSNTNEPLIINTEPSPELLMSQPQVDYMFIKGSRIRYFHIPENEDIIDCMEQQIAFYQRKKDPKERPFNWKSYRKKQKFEQMKTKMAEIQQAKPSGSGSS